MNLSEAMAYLAHTQKFGSILGLERMENLMRRLGHPEKGLRFLHVAGTNGKGSTAVLLATVLLEEGYRVGLYTSPGLHRVNDRIQVDGKDIPDGDLAKAIGRIAVVTKEMEKKGEEHPTEFEILTAAAFLYFSEAACDFVVLEVGLGGRLDSTNIISAPLVSVITPVDYDHMEILGETLGAIAKEKAGILKAGTRLVIHPQAPEADKVIRATAHSLKISVTEAPVHRAVLLPFDGTCQPFVLEGKTYHLSLLGVHQVRNAVVALTALAALREQGIPVSEKAVTQGLLKVRWPGRFEILSRDPLILADGAHNLQGAATLSENLAAYFPGRKAVFLMGALKDKPYRAMVEAVRLQARSFVTLTPQTPRGLPAETLAKAVQDLKMKGITARDSEEGLTKALEILRDGDLIVGFGSLYMLGDFRESVLLRFPQ